MSLEAFNRTYVQKLAQGDRETERHFLAAFDDLLTLKLRARLRSKHAVEDIRQETYARVFVALKGKRGLDRPERLGAFVHSVCNHVLLEFYRVDSRTQPLPDGGFELADHGGDIESSLVKEERERQVASLMACLPEKDREILRLLFYDECDKDEICRRLNVDRGYLRVLVHRATAKLRRSCAPLGLSA
jgi:RNA polymerase sigma-70 factor (ECF subfamily)